MINAKWVFRVKRNLDGSIKQHKVRLVAKGFSQMLCIDSDETFAPVVKVTFIRIMCTLAVKLNLYFHHLDVTTAFLNETLEEEIYMRLPEGSGQDTGRVVKLNRSLYGLKQASCAWNKLLDTELKTLGYTHIHADYCICVPRWENNLLPHSLLMMWVWSGIISM